MHRRLTDDEKNLTVHIEGHDQEVFVFHCQYNDGDRVTVGNGTMAIGMPTSEFLVRGLAGLETLPPATPVAVTGLPSSDIPLAAEITDTGLPLINTPQAMTGVPGVIPASGLADSGGRQDSVTGSTREPKAVEDGRWDLIPAECMAHVVCRHAEGPIADQYLDLCMALDTSAFPQYEGARRVEEVVGRLADFATFVVMCMGGVTGALHRLAVLYARGSVKYAVRNWEKGQQTGWVVSSLHRHFKKHCAGQLDEDHLAAVLWNVFTLMHHLPRIADGRLPRELDDYGLVGAA